MEAEKDGVEELEVRVRVDAMVMRWPAEGGGVLISSSDAVATPGDGS